MQPAAETDRDRLRANIDALSRLLQLADRLKRTNPAKWDVTKEDWLAAVRAAVSAPEGRPGDAADLAAAIELGHGIVRRLGDSGEARLVSAGVGRHPDSSHAGRRFYADLESARRRLAELRELARAYPPAAPDRPGE